MNRRQLLTPGWALAGIALLAAAVRLALLVHSGGLYSAIEYDDGVHYGSSALLLHGFVPYRDYDFLQPPGITWLFMPWAVIGRVFGDANGLVLARLATITAAAATTVLIGRLVTRVSTPRRGLLAAMVYAIAAPAVVAGRTAMLEPWLGLLLVIAYGRLGAGLPSRRDSWIGGVALGLAVTVKAWGLVAAIVLVGWMLLRYRGASGGPIRRVVAGAGSAIAAICLPFFVLAPGRMINDVVTAQLTRPVDGSSTTYGRWTQLIAVRPLFAHPHTVALVAVAALVWCVMLAVRRSPLGGLMAGQLVAGLTMFALSGPYFFHYGDYVILPFAALLALAMPSPRPVATRLPQLRVAVAWLALYVVAIGGLVQLADGWTQGRPATVNVARLTALVRGSRCVASDQLVLMELADALGHSCRPWPDPRGTALATLATLPESPDFGTHFYPFGFRRLAWWQRDWRAELAASSTVILTGSPCHRSDWTPALCHQFERDFRYLGSAGRATPALLPVEVWRRTGVDSKSAIRRSAPGGSQE